MLRSTTPCDVLAPCALGGAVDRGNVEALRCRIVCGSANNLLAEEFLAERLRERGILCAPDFVANAGGLISVYRELRGLGGEGGRPRWSRASARRWSGCSPTPTSAVCRRLTRRTSSPGARLEARPARNRRVRN